MSEEYDQVSTSLPTSRSDSRNAASPRLLVVDDSPDLRDAMLELLSVEGYKCDAAADGIDAIALASRLLPDLIIMDISMPRLSGVQAARHLRANGQTSNITIIAHTALDEGDVIRKMENFKFDGYCRKGHGIGRLLQLVRKLLNSQR